MDAYRCAWYTFHENCKRPRIELRYRNAQRLLVDRIRQEVANNTIAPELVTILFFEKTGDSTQVHPISVDRNGNAVNTPDGYGRFFLDEEINLLRRGGANVRDH